MVRGAWGQGVRRSSVLWDPHLSSRGRSPLRPQSLLVRTASRCTGAAPGSGFLKNNNDQKSGRVEEQETELVKTELIMT